MTRRKFWWNCQHMKSSLGVAYCIKYDNFCLKSKCDEMDDTKGKLEKELEND